MKVLTIGASGFIGGELLEEFSKAHDVLGTFYSRPAEGFVHLDVRDKSKVEELVGSFKPDAILYLAANPNVEYCEDHPEETWQINVNGTANTLEIAEKLGAKFVYFSTDYVFDGKAGPYLENDTTNPINAYGRQKLASEEIIKKNLVNYLIIRTTIVYGWENTGKNFIMQMINALKEGRVMKVPKDQFGTPTYVKNLCRAVRELVEKDKTGVYHISGNDLIDRYKFAQNVASVFSLDKDLLIPISTSEFKNKAHVPEKAGLKVEKARKELKTELLGVKEGLELARKDIRKEVPTNEGRRKENQSANL
jgi:dTDP-4-dehydrorhamnose reductase